MHIGTTLTQFIIEEQRHIAGATGEFTALLNDLVTSIKVISNAGKPGEGMTNVMDLFTSKGGTHLASAVEAFAQRAGHRAEQRQWQHT